MENEMNDMDFDSTSEASGATDNQDSTASEVDQVAALLLEGEDLDELEERDRDNAKTKIFNADGSEKTNTKAWTTTPVDRHGNREFGGSNAPEREQPEREPTVFGAFTGHKDREVWLNDAAEQVNAYRRDVQAQYETGRLTYEEFQQA